MTETTTRAYYTNSLYTWRSKLQLQLRREMARYARMEKQCHPDKKDQGKLIELLQKAVMAINDEIRSAS